MKYRKNKYEAVLDAANIVYAAASVGESTNIVTTHLPSGRTKEFKNKTEFWGRGKKIGGWLASLNEERTKDGLKLFEKEDFSIETVQVIKEPLENVLHTAKQMFKGQLELLNTNKYIMFVDKGESFRVQKSTIIEYKGNRKDTLRPLYKDQVSDYLVKVFGATPSEYYESDDRVIMTAYGHPNRVVQAVDKDSGAQPVNFMNVLHPEWGILECDSFGELWISNSEPNAKGVVNETIRGHGRKFLYWQLGYGDKVDNYFANSATDTKWGEKSAYNELVNCKDDTEAWKALIGIYKALYPEPKEVLGWRGNPITIDWKYMLQENYVMAKMLTSEDCVISVKDELNKLLIKF